MTHPCEHRQPMNRFKSDEFNKFYWIGKWFDAAREFKVTDRKAAAAMFAGNVALAEIHITEMGRLREESAAAANNARHFGALI